MENINYIPDWAKQAVIYHIYPYGFFNTPKFSKQVPNTLENIKKLRNFYDHFHSLGINTIQMGPVFESVSHGYDIVDYMRIDRRLGDNELFKEIIDELHDNNFKIILDGVFNHVSREFESFQDILKNRHNSTKLHWHFIDFSRDNPYHDGFDYKNWENHYELVKLNLNNPEVKEFIFSVAKYWMTEFKIDGWRLDVAYEIQPDFWKNFRNFCKNINPDCFLLGELIYEPYNKYVGPELLDAGTNFQIYKSVWSSFNSNNMHELKAVLERSFHKNWGLYKNIVMVNFLGNHDTTRIRSILTDERGIYPAFIFLFTTLGIPKIYYGDEIGMFGIKKPDSDEDIRKPMPMSETDWPENGKYIFDHVKNLIKIRNQNHALIYGSIDYLYADNNYLAFIRKSSLQTILVIINTINSPEIKKIPLWNQNLDGSKFIELLDQGGKKEYIIQNNHLTAEFFPYWGRILLKID